MSTLANNPKVSTAQCAKNEKILTVINFNPAY